MKSLEQLKEYFSNEPGLLYVDKLEMRNNSFYRGQVKIIDQATRRRLESSEDNSSVRSFGAIQNRLSNKAESLQGSQNQSQGIGQQQIEQQAEDERCKIRHGYGVMYWIDGAHYEGYWVMNKAEGHGTFWHAEGDVYRGEFKNDMANGFGEYTHINGSRYKGAFRDDV